MSDLYEFQSKMETPEERAFAEVMERALPEMRVYEPPRDAFFRGSRNYGKSFVRRLLEQHAREAKASVECWENEGGALEPERPPAFVVFMDELNTAMLENFEFQVGYTRLHFGSWRAHD